MRSVLQKKEKNDEYIMEKIQSEIREVGVYFFVVVRTINPSIDPF